MSTKSFLLCMGLFALCCSVKSGDQSETVREKSWRVREWRQVKLSRQNDGGVQSVCALDELEVTSCNVGTNRCSWFDSDKNEVTAKDETSGLWQIDEMWETKTKFEVSSLSEAIKHAYSSTTSSDPLNENTQLSFPIFVLSDPERQDRASHIKKLIRSVGLSGEINFIPFTRAEAIDMEVLIQEGTLSTLCEQLMTESDWIGRNAIRSHVANALDFLRTLQFAVELRYEMFAMFEDDLMLADEPTKIRMRLLSALQNYPRSADMLYLESCFEDCWERKASPAFPMWSKTSGPSCSAAILFTQKGAQRVSTLAKKIFWGIDNMYRAMISAHLVEAYVISPNAFLQDGYWGSSMQRYRGRRRRYGDRSLQGVTHRPFSVLCNKVHKELSLVVAQVSEETAYACTRLIGSASCLTPSDHEDQLSPFKLLLLSDIMWHDLPSSCWEFFHIIYYTGRVDGAPGLVEVGRWPGLFGHEGALLRIPKGSLCFEKLGLEPCRFVLKAMGEVTEWKVEQHEVVEAINYVLKNIHDLDDILISSLRSMVHSRGVSQNGRVVDCGVAGFLSRPCFENASRFYAPTRCPDKVHSLSAQTPRVHDTITIRSSETSSNGHNSASTSCSNTALTGVHFVFDGIGYQISKGKMFGINKMWYNILPYMADIVHSMNGTFTHCQSTWREGGEVKSIDLPRMQNVICENISDFVAGLPGKHVIFFSSYYRLLDDADGHTFCNILPIYDFIPERTNLYAEQHDPFYMKRESIPRANGFLSLSQSTTDDLAEFYGISDKFVSTSPNRVSPIFHRTPEFLEADFGDGFLGCKEIEAVLNSNAKYLFLIGYSDYSPPYKGYDIFFDALRSMPEVFKAEFTLVVVGWPPARRQGLPRIVYAPDVPEEALPLIYSRASALVYPSRYEGFGMPPIEATACGCPVMLGSFYEEKMRYVYGDDALYAGTVPQMQEALRRVANGQVPTPDCLMERARLFGGDPRHGWNEVAKDYLEYMLEGPFLGSERSSCRAPLSSECVESLGMHTTDEGLGLTHRCGDCFAHAQHQASEHKGSPGPAALGAAPPDFTLLVSSSMDPRRWFRPAQDHEVRPLLIPFATVPRSGTTIVRRVFEAATGLATESEYADEGGSCQRCFEEPLSLCLWTDCIDSWARLKPNTGNITSCDRCDVGGGGHRCETLWCGCADQDGESLFPRFCKADAEKDPILVKTHFPFLNDSALTALHALEKAVFPGVLLTIRHPLSNYDAWRRFLSDKDRKIAPQSNFQGFMAKWVSHFTFWEDYAERSGTPLLLVRYEDLTAEPHSTFEKLFVGLGLGDELLVSATELKRAVDFAIDQHKSLEITFPVSQCVEKGHRRPFRIPEYENSDVCGPNVDAEDLLWLDRNHAQLLGKFGYETLPL